MTQKSDVLEILSLLISFIDHATDDDLKRLKSVLVSGSEKGKGVRKASPQKKNNWASLATRLLELATRQQGLDVLAKADLTRKELEGFAKSYDVHVIKTDSAAHISEKIVEAFIGARLSSQAVRGVHIKEG